MALWCNGITSTRRVEGPKINTWWGQSFQLQNTFLSLLHLVSCLVSFLIPFFLPFLVATARTQAHPAHPALVDTHTWARVLCFFVSDVSGVCSRLFFRCFVGFWFCGFFACLLFSLVTSAGLAPFWAWRFQLVFSFFLSSFFFFPTIQTTSTWCTR